VRFRIDIVPGKQPGEGTEADAGNQQPKKTIMFQYKSGMSLDVLNRRDANGSNSTFF
jgi:hypothetical protein